MGTQAVAAYGTTLKRSGVSIAEINNISDLEITTNFIDVTSHASPDGYREYILDKIKDGGELTLEGNFIAGDTNGQIALHSDCEAGTLSPYVLTFPDGTSFSFNAFVSKFKIGSPMEKQLDFGATLKISGKPTLGISVSAGLTTPFFVVSNDAVITPAASGSVYEYVANVLTGVTSVTITPTATAGVITINGNVVATGVASSAIVLGAAGSMTTAIIVVTETAKAPKTYTVRIIRAAS